MAMAPVIGDIPSPIVGNQASGSQATRYVYVDAFNLDQLATDDTTASANLKWSYELVPPAKYSVNGDQILSGTDDPVAPPAAKLISATLNSIVGATSPTGEDGNPKTVTIRNINLYPYGGSPSTDMTQPAQNWANNMQAVSFWCSDGNLASSQTVMFYTDNTYTNNVATGWNRLSNPTVWTRLKDDPINTFWKVWDPLLDKCTTHTTNGAGICFNVALTGNNWGSVQSPMPYFTLTDNTVYRIRLTMNSSQSSVGKVPLWDFIIENWNGDGTKGLNLYGADNIYLDNEGGANTVLSSSTGSVITMFYAPAAFQTAQFKNTTTGLYQPSLAAKRNPCLRFRVLDVDSNTALLNNQKSGSICVQRVVVDSIAYSAMTVGANKYSNTALKAATATAGVGNVNASKPLVSATISYTATANAVTITPTVSGANDGRQNELIAVVPATDTVNHYNWDGSNGGALGTGLVDNTMLDDYPIAWTPNTLYRLEAKLGSPTANDAASPWDVIFMTIEPPSNEVITESYVTAQGKYASPAVAATSASDQAYYMFYYGGAETKSTKSQVHNLRWRVRFGNSTALNMPAASNTVNTGAVRLSSVKVDVVSFPN
jgi:hypothetical protein